MTITTPIPKTKEKHYVNNEHFLEKMVVFRAAVNESKLTNGERPRVPEYIGECMFKIATHLARKPNFANYTFKEDMVSDGIENCLLYIDNFDPEKSKNPFAYFTQIIYYAFLRRIQKEKKHLYIKYKSMDNMIITSLIENNGEEYVTSSLNGLLHDAYSEEFISDFINTFEANKDKKIASAKPRKKKKDDVAVFDEFLDNTTEHTGTSLV
jgi:DNA-directed RNA polymerase specialized sigma24 family protein